MSKTPECLSDFALDLVIVEHSQSPGQAAHLKDCQRCCARLQLLQSDREAYEKSLPHRRLPAKTKATKPSWLSGFRWQFPVVIVGLAVAFLFFVNTSDSVPPQGVRLKGNGLGFDYYVLRSGKTLAGSSLSQLQAGDRVRFSVYTKQNTQLAIFSIDGNGTRSVFFSDGEKSSSVAGASSEILLNESVVLDESLGEEDVYALFCKQPFALAEVMNEWRTKNQMVRKGCQVLTLKWEKVSP